ncbi:MAG: methyltransferase domain-containing protein [Rhodopseudomonas sp.]|nr:methyltransferase domain-containing protein [Rhodopseudomonas sp.]
MGKASYLWRSLVAQMDAARFNCPNCGGGGNDVVDRKYGVTQLRRCQTCRLLFRTPTDDPLRNASFYENDYVQGFTTSLPDDAALAVMMERGFAGSEKDYAYYIGVLTRLGVAPGSSLFDFGCSWGYGSYQLARAGYEVAAYEVAPSRRRYARDKLAVRVVDDMGRCIAALAGTFDCFFAAHVIEHVPSPARAFDHAMRLLKPGGLFVSFTPNGSAGHRAASSDWSKLWGEVHPNFIDDVFLDYNFRSSPRVVGSSPVSEAGLPASPELARLDDLAGGELFFAARKAGEAWA